MLNAPEPLDAVLARLAAEPSAWVRLAAARYDDAWEVEVCDIVTGVPPASWRGERMIYRDGIFIALRTKGSAVVRELSWSQPQSPGST